MKHLRYTYLVNEIYSLESFGLVQYNEQLLLKLRALAESANACIEFGLTNLGMNVMD